MNKTMTRKVLLLSLIAVFLCIYILQLVFNGRSKIKDVTLEATPDSILIVKGKDPANESNSVRLTYENSSWNVGEKKYPADSATATKMSDGIKTIKLLGIITRNAGVAAEKYGLDDASKLVVTGFKEGKSVRTITVGKDTTAGGQCYVQIDGKDTVYLADGSLHDTYGATIDAIRSKDVYAVTADDIVSVRVTTAEGTYAVQKNVPKADLTTAGSDSKKADKAKDTKAKDTKADEAAPAEQPKWTLTENTTALTAAAPDEEKVASWAKSLSSLKVSSWAAENETLPAETPTATVSLAAAGKEYTVTIYKIDGDDPRYICSANTTPYLFYVTKYSAEKFTKALSDLATK